ncbi:unnamed protein product [Protopolystoma xenopodis]|uniref:Uncharacterized protein n=1 Tax=Protopolystoma xenopodis TaxID=117903 RepID=A0A3S5B858_9PLAT|nr:unnamed protein product [Protopolystoma xenopodis]
MTEEWINWLHLPVSSCVSLPTKDTKYRPTNLALFIAALDHLLCLLETWRPPSFFFCLVDYRSKDVNNGLNKSVERFQHLVLRDLFRSPYGAMVSSRLRNLRPTPLSECLSGWHASNQTHKTFTSGSSTIDLGEKIRLSTLDLKSDSLHSPSSFSSNVKSSPLSAASHLSMQANIRPEPSCSLPLLLDHEIIVTVLMVIYLFAFPYEHLISNTSINDILSYSNKTSISNDELITDSEGTIGQQKERQKELPSGHDKHLSMMGALSNLVVEQNSAWLPETRSELHVLRLLLSRLIASTHKGPPIGKRCIESSAVIAKA